MKNVTARTAATIVLAIAGLASCSSSGSGAAQVPIVNQNCHQLAKTYAVINRDLGPTQSFDTQAAAGKRAVQLNSRVDALGGCSSEPSIANASAGTHDYVWSAADQQQFIASCGTANPSLSGAEESQGCAQCLTKAETKWKDLATANDPNTDWTGFYIDVCGLPNS